MSSPVDSVVTLPRGLDREAVGDGDSGWIRDLTLRPLTGHDEEFVARTTGAHMVTTVTGLLERCVTDIGGAAPLSDDIGAMTLGDREALLLHLRRAVFGDRIDGELMCPDDRCGERIDLDLTVHDLLVEPDPNPARWYDERFESEAGDVDLRFRLPTGADQAAASGADDPERMVERLLVRCVVAARFGAVDISPVDLPGDVVTALAARMSERDPQAEIHLTFDCPACGRTIDVAFDTASYLVAEIAAASDRLAEEVHALAWHYHWPESEILALPQPRRRRYLDLIAQSVNNRGAA